MFFLPMHTDKERISVLHTMSRTVVLVEANFNYFPVSKARQAYLNLARKQNGEQYTDYADLFRDGEISKTVYTICMTQDSSTSR